MSSMDDKTSPADGEASVGESASGKSLVPVRQDEPASDAGGSRASPAARRWIVPAALIALTGGVGWYAGAQSGATATGAQRAQIEDSLASEIRAQSVALAALDARLKSIESAPRAEASLKPAIEILAQRIDEIARKQTTALTQTSNRLDRSDKEIGARLDRMNERMNERLERVEKQVSAAAAVGSVQKNVTAVSRSAPETSAKVEPPAKADEREDRAVRGYVLRDVFRGGALVESRYGLMEVFPGAQLPGAGRVRSVEKRDGRWVVVTTAGLIEGRH